ncbi:MAG: hypothetical protein GY832_21265, partial [Chloroflexi bacterium]|nr:hypothetical protein [Chloroflexota bacterium]
MNKNRIAQISFLAIFAMLFALLGGATTIAQDQNPPNQADAVAITITAGKISWKPQIDSGGYTLTISGPSDFYLSQTYQSGDRPVLRIADQVLPAGVYKYEFQFMPLEKMAGRDGGAESLTTAAEAPVQSGSFAIFDGRFVLQDTTEDADEGVREPAGVLAPDDQVILDDLIVDGSLCVGFDCVNGESFGFDTIRLKENNLRIHFQDTSASASFPTTDWRIAINDSANGGLSYFAIQDVDAGRTVFQIEAGAGSNALYVDDYGRVGLGTSTPAVELEVRDSDTPSVRLNQDGSGGWSPQTWDMAGNEANFFIRDVTNGSQLPFRIQPGADSNALTIRSDNKVGIGTWAPDAPLEIERSDGTAKILVTELNGTVSAREMLKFSNKGGSYIHFENTDSGQDWYFTSENVSPYGFIINNSAIAGPEFRLDTDGDLTISGDLVTGGSGNCAPPNPACDGVFLPDYNLLAIQEH